MVNKSTNINKMDNHLSPQTTEHKKKPWHMCWKSGSWLGTSTSRVQRLAS